MGIKGFTSNRKRKAKASKSDKWHRSLKAEKKKRLPAASIEIEDVELFSKEKLKNKLRNPKNNIKISGKKKRRLTKRLGHGIREKSQMEVEVSSTGRRKGTSQTAPPEAAVDEVMGDELEDAAAVDETVATTSGTDQRRKRRRGGKKHKKKSAADQEGEDVDMEEDL